MDSALIECVAKTYELTIKLLEFVLKAAVTVLATAFLIFGAIDIVHWPGLFHALKDECDELEKYWFVAFTAPIFALIDLATGLPAVFVFLSWRSCETYHKINNELLQSSSDGCCNSLYVDTHFSMETRIICWKMIFLVFFDIVGAVGYVPCVLCPWRWKSMYETCEMEGKEVVVEGLRGTEKRPPPNSMHRQSWRSVGYANCFFGFMDIVTGFPLVISGLTWRCGHVYTDIKEELDKYEALERSDWQYCVEARSSIWINFFKVFWDIPFILMAAFTTVTLIRVIPFWKRMHAQAVSHRGSSPHSHPWYFEDYRPLIFEELVTLFLDIVGYVGYVPCVLCPWRWKSMYETCEMEGKEVVVEGERGTEKRPPPNRMHRQSWRSVGYANCFFGFMDIVTGFPLVISGLTWRCGHVYTDIKEQLYMYEAQQRSDWQYCVEARSSIWINFFKVFWDIPFILMAAFTTVTLIRAIPFWKRMHAQAVSHRGSSPHSHPWYFEDYRPLCFNELLRAIALLLLVPFMAILGATWYRLNPCREEVRSVEKKLAAAEEKQGQRSPTAIADSDQVFTSMLCAVLTHSVAVLIDAFFVPFGMFVVITALRTHKYCRLMLNVPSSEPSHAAYRRIETLKNFFLVIRDIFFVALSPVLLLSPIRIFVTFRQIWLATRRETDPTPLLQVTLVVPEYVNGDGWKITVSGKKPADLRIDDIEMNVIGSAFWKELRQTTWGFGRKKLGQYRLPLQLCPTFIEKRLVNNSLVDFNVSVLFRSTTRYTTMLKDMRRMRNTELPLDIVLYCNNRTNTLFSLRTTVRELMDVEEHERPLSLTGLRESSQQREQQPVVVAVEEPAERLLLRGNTEIMERQGTNEEEMITPLIQSSERVESYGAAPVHLQQPAPPTSMGVEERYGPFVCDVLWWCIGNEVLEVPLDVVAIVLFIMVHIIPPRAFYMYRDILHSTHNTTKSSVSALLHSFIKIARRDNHEGFGMLESVRADLCANSKDTPTATVSLTPPLQSFVDESLSIVAEITSTLASSSIVTPAASLICIYARNLLTQCAAYTVCFWSTRLSDLQDAGWDPPSSSKRRRWGPRGNYVSWQPPQEAVIRRPGAAVDFFADALTDFPVNNTLLKAKYEKLTLDEATRSNGAAWREVADANAETEHNILEEIDNELSILRAFEGDHATPWYLSANKIRSSVFYHWLHMWQDIIVVFGIVLLTLFVYRAWSVYCVVCETRRWKRALLFIFYEILIDCVFLMLFLVVLCSVMYSVNMIIDLVSVIYTKRSYESCREVIWGYIGRIGDNLIFTGSLIFAWKFVKYFVAVAMFLPLTPAELMSSLLKITDVVVILLITAAIYATPFVAVFVLVPKGHNYYGYGLGAIALVVGALTCLSVVAITIKARRKVLWERDLVNPVNTSYLRLSSRYVFHFVLLLLEAYQLCALPLHLNADWGGAEWPYNVAKWAFLSNADSANYYPAGYYLSFTAVLLFALIFSLPIVYHSLLKKEGKIWHHPTWHLFVDFLGSALVLTVTFNLMSFAVCSDATPPTLTVGSITKPCWYGTEETRKYGLMALIAMIYYAPSIILKCTRWPEPPTHLGVRFHGYVITLQSLVHLILAACAAFLYDKATIYCVVQLIVLTAYVVFTVKNDAPLLPVPRLCTVWEFNCWQNAVHFCGIVSAVATLAALSFPSGSSTRSTMSILFLIGCALVVVASILRVYVVPRFVKSQEDREYGPNIAELRNGCLSLEEALSKTDSLVGWPPRNAVKWKSAAGNIASCADFIDALLDFDRHVDLSSYMDLFRKRHASWMSDALKLRNSVLNEDSFNDLLDKLQDLKNGTDASQRRNEERDLARADTENRKPVTREDSLDVYLAQSLNRASGTDSQHHDGHRATTDVVNVPFPDVQQYFSHLQDPPNVTVEDAPAYAPLRHEDSV